MLEGRTRRIAFGPFQLLPTERRLEKEGRPIHLGSRALDLLLILVDHAGQVVPNATLLESVWGGVNVEESSLRFHIKNLRKVLSDNHPDAARYVTNVPGRGYCLAATVERIDREDAPKSSLLTLESTTNWPTRTSAIIGRSDSINVVLRELSDRRLVTIVGSAGIGKTTLAIAAAELLHASFSDGVFFIDLSPIDDPALVVSALSSVVEGASSANLSASAIVHYLRDKRCLLVLDNCEQVIETVAKLADRILRDTKDVHMLITSREMLRITGERVHRLLPLEYPPNRANLTADEAMAYASVQLFVERATESASGLSIDDENAPAIGEICRRLDGIPLAIELAAARVEIFGVFSLAKALNDMFVVLTRGRRFALPRHQTLRAALDWGYSLLSSTESAALRYISIFRAPFPLEAALAVIEGPIISHSVALDAMASLVCKSLVSVDRVGSAARYRLLESTRLYAREMLDASNESSDIARRHALYYLNCFKEEMTDRVRWPSLFANIIDDVRAALDWSFSVGGDFRIGLELISASSQLWFRMSLVLEYSERIERALKCLPELSEQSEKDVNLEMRFQAAFAHALWYARGDWDAIERAATRALELAERIGDKSFQLQGLWGMWAAKRGRGEFKAALALATRYKAIADQVGNKSFALLGDRMLGLTHHLLGEQEIAKEVLEQVLEVGRLTKNKLNTDFQLAPDLAALAPLIRIYWLQGYPNRALSALHEAIESARRSDHWFSLYYVLVFAGLPLSLWIGDLTNAHKYLDLMINSSAEVQRRQDWALRRQCWALVLRLRQGDECDALTAAFLEPRLDIHTYTQISSLASASTIPVPLPDDKVGDNLWSLPEILRVNAEIMLWRGGMNAAEAAESKLLGALDIARQQGTLSWELRAATSLAQLWHRRNRAADARDLLTGTFDRFSEGFETCDVTKARQLLAQWS